MTDFGPTIATLLVAGAVAIGGLIAGDSGDRVGQGSRTALVIDAPLGRDGHELVDARLRAVDAALRLPRTAAEARANVGYFAARGYRVIVAGSRSGAAADAAGVSAERSRDLAGALAAVGR
jgi:hypothetical protein